MTNLTRVSGAPLLRDRVALSPAAILMLIIVATAADARAAVRLGSDTEAPPQRVALLIGNSTYQHVPSLKNPKNDVAQMERSLKKVGFQTTVVLDVDHDRFVDALAAFSSHIEPGAIALFYFSGHGVQSASQNYLLPVNLASASNGVAIRGSGISLGYVRDALSAARLSIIVLDACRTMLPAGTKDVTNGLVPFTSRGVLVAYAADEGQAASENAGEDVSLFTKHFIKELDIADEPLCAFFERIREAVDLASDHAQFPFVYDGVIGNFIFHRGETAELRRLNNLKDAAAAYAAAGKSNNPNDLAALLTMEPNNTAQVQTVKFRLSSLMADTIKPVGVLPLDAGAEATQVAIANQAHRLFYGRAYDKSLALYQELLRARPSDPVILYDHATCLLRVGKLQEAADELSRSIQLRPKWPWAFLNRGVAKHLQGQLKEAAADYSEAIRLVPQGSAVAYNNRALAKRELRDLKTARNDTKAALDVDKDYAPTYFNDAAISKGLGDLITAEKQTAVGQALIIPSGEM